VVLCLAHGFLVSHGADTTAQDKDGLTPLHHALARGNLNVAWLLVEHGTDPTAQDNDGLTPLHRLSRSFLRDVDLARVLVEHGADVTAQDKEGMTPLHCASIWGDMDLARLWSSMGRMPQPRTSMGGLHFIMRRNRDM